MNKTINHYIYYLYITHQNIFFFFSIFFSMNLFILKVCIELQCKFFSTYILNFINVFFLDLETGFVLVLILNTTNFVKKLQVYMLKGGNYFFNKIIVLKSKHQYEQWEVRKISIKNKLLNNSLELALVSFATWRFAKRSQPVNDIMVDESIAHKASWHSVITTICSVRLLKEP